MGKKPTTTWKGREAKTAKFFCKEGRRTPLSGGNSGHTRSDTLDKKLFIEHKHRKTHAVINLWDQVKKLAKKEKKIPLVTLSVHGRPGFWIMCHSKDFDKILEQRKECVENEQEKVVSKTVDKCG